MKYLHSAASIILVYAFSLTAMAQENGSTDNSSADQIRADINTQIWATFTRSYKELDAELHMNLYNPNIVRVTPQKDSVLSGEEYIKMTGRMLEMRRSKSSIGSDIQFRFNQRYHNDNSAYEAGIYRMSGTGRDGQPFVFYNEFSVVLKKHEDRWTIMFDMDEPSNESAWQNAPIRIGPQSGTN